MEKNEPTFVPEWLKNSGNVTTTSHQSSLQSDDQSASKSVRRNPLVKSGDNNSGRPTTSSYFRRSSSSNGPTRLRSYSSFGRRDWDKNKEKYENRFRDYSNPLANILPSRFEKDGLRRSQSNLSAKRGESWPRKVTGEKNNVVRNNGKISFERDFPSLGSEEKQLDSEIGRVPSPGFNSVMQSLPVGSSGVTGGDVWTSALVEVPVMVGTNAPTTVAAGRNMAETLIQGPPRVTAPQLSVGTQRLEELAVKQSRQLIPMTPSTPKSLALNSSDKPKLKVGHIVNHSPSTRPADVTKSSSSTIGKLHVLKPSRERNSTSIEKESLSPTGGSKLRDSPLAESKPRVCKTRVEKRPSPQAKSRNDFFNLMRKKSMANSSPTSPVPVASTNDKPSGENKVDSSDACVVTEKSRSSSDVILNSEEEARFLRSLGWEETTDDEEGLTEEEISSFYRDLSKYVNSSFFKGTQLKSLMPLNLVMGKNGGDTKVDS